MQNQPGDHSYAGPRISAALPSIFSAHSWPWNWQGHRHGGQCSDGAIVGDNIDNQGGSNPSQQTRQERHYQTVDNWTQQITGYTVVHRYQGREFSSVLPYDPSQELPLPVSIMPATIQPVDRYSPPLQLESRVGIKQHC